MISHNWDDIFHNWDDIFHNWDDFFLNWDETFLMSGMKSLIGPEFLYMIFLKIGGCNNYVTLEE